MRRVTEADDEMTAALPAPAGLRNGSLALYRAIMTDVRGIVDDSERRTGAKIDGLATAVHELAAWKQLEDRHAERNDARIAPLRRVAIWGASHWKDVAFGMTIVLTWALYVVGAR